MCWSRHARYKKWFDDFPFKPYQNFKQKESSVYRWKRHLDFGYNARHNNFLTLLLCPLKSLGHTVQMVTAHHDPSHCFEETRDGTLDVKCVGDWLPRLVILKLSIASKDYTRLYLQFYFRSFGGYCYALCAYIRMIYAALYLVLFSLLEPEVVICDQVSAYIPFIKWAPLPAAKKPSKVIFYCHFPDQVNLPITNLLRRLYLSILMNFVNNQFRYNSSLAIISFVSAFDR